MKLLLIVLFCIVGNNQIFGQQVFEYRRNVITGNMEVFEKSSETLFGKKVGELSQNIISGYYELKTFNQTSNKITVINNIYSNRPTYDATAYYQNLLTQINTLNQLEELKKINTNQIKDEYYKSQARKLEFENRSLIIENIFSFYNSQKTFPSNLKDGWYETMEIQQYDKQFWQKALDGATIKFMNNCGFVKIEKNKIVEYYRSLLRPFYTSCISHNVFQKVNFDYVETVKECKASYKTMGTGDKGTIYFINNLVNPDQQIANPNFSYYTLYTDNLRVTKDEILIQIARNQVCNTEDIKNLQFGGYFTGLPSQINNSKNFPSCNISNMTLAFKGLNGPYSIGIISSSDANKIWTLDNINFVTSNCLSSTLTD